MLRQFSLAKLGLFLGGGLTILGMVGYFTGNAVSVLELLYGLPILLGGLALKVSELKPVPYSEPTSPEIMRLREQQATQTQNQIRKDVTRYRYGQEAHLDDSLERLGLSPTDEERPVLEQLKETQVNGYYALVLEFESPQISLDQWQEKREKIERYFGPGIRVELTEPETDKVDVALIANPSTREV
ncbi:MAG: DUF2854 domain-containing protein [Chroococcales cyanobacterium]